MKRRDNLKQPSAVGAAEGRERQSAGANLSFSTLSLLGEKGNSGLAAVYRYILSAEWGQVNANDG